MQTEMGLLMGLLFLSYHEEKLPSPWLLHSEDGVGTGRTWYCITHGLNTLLSSFLSLQVMF